MRVISPRHSWIGCQGRGATCCKAKSSHPYPLAFPVAAEHTLAVELKAVGTLVHAFEDGGRGLARHRHAAASRPGAPLQALDLQERAGET